MSWKSLLVMLVLVGGLLYLNSERQGQLQTDLEAVDAEYVLFPQLQSQLVSEIRIDNLERAYQIKFERDASGFWYLTDPVPYPATSAIVTSLLGAIHVGLAQRVENEDLVSLGLDPPKVVVELKQRRGEDIQSFRLDLGEPGLNQNRIFARVQGPTQPDGEVVSISRAIYNALVRFPHDFRDRNVTPFNPANIISFKREGRYWDRELQAERSLDFEMLRDGAQWRREDEPHMSLNPQIAGFLVSSAARIKVETFEQDLPKDLAVFGLQEPAFSIEIATGENAPMKLEFGHPEAAPGVDISIWFFQRAGFPHVWSIEQEKILMLLAKPEDLYNPYLVQALRENIIKLELRLGEERLLLERETLLSKDRWFLTLRKPDVPEVRFPAALGAVKDLLAKLEGAEVNYSEGIPFDTAESIGSISISTEDGTLFGGLLGARWKDTERGLVGYRYQRFGDDLPGLLDESLAELCQAGGIDPSSFRPKNIHQIRWADARRVELSHGERTFVYTHSADDKRWTVDPGGEQRRRDAPKVFTDSVLGLLSLFSESWLLDFDASSLQQRLGVIVFDGTGNGLSFELGLDPKGRLVCLENGSAARVSEDQLRNFEAAHGTGLLEGLIELFKAE